MNRFRIWKTEFLTFNVLHALGLAVVLSEGTNEEVHLRDCGASFVLTVEGEIESRFPGFAIEDILHIPSTEGIARADKLALGNLDGLLAATFTMPGPRVLSVADLKSKAVQRPEITAPAIEKVVSLVSRVSRSVHNQLGSTANWISLISEEYHDECAVVPQFQAPNGKCLTVTMPLDPAFGFSSRRPCSDAMINQKAALCMRTPRLGAALAYVGAARYLRAQRTKGSGILLYVQEFTNFVVKPHSICGRLPASEVPAQQAMYVHWLSTWRTYYKSASGILIQTMQTQGAKQSISTCRARLSFAPLNCLEQHGCSGIVRYWRSVLGRSRAEVDVESDLLIDLLSTFDHAAIRAYLTDLARRGFGKSEPSNVHTIEELEAMIACNPGNGSAMAQIVERTKGTLRFAQAIRLLGEHNRSAAKEIIDDLDVVQSQDKLLRVLARSVQQCVLAKAKNNFIIVPDEEDVVILLEDIAVYGVSNVTSLLIILAAIRYPRNPNTDASTDATALDSQATTTDPQGDL